MNYSDGWIIDDLIIFGGLDEKGYVSKGFSLECPNVQNASNDFKNLFADRMKNALITLYQIKPEIRLQFRWSVDSNYKEELAKYKKDTEKAPTEWCRFAREQIHEMFYSLMMKKQLRRERVYLYIATECSGMPSFNLSGKKLQEYYQNTLHIMKGLFAQFQKTLESTLGAAEIKVMPLTSEETAKEMAMFFNPSFKEREEQNINDFYDPQKSILANFGNSGFLGGTPDKKKLDYGFVMDGYYFNTLYMKKWPSMVMPGILDRVLKDPQRKNVLYCVNLTPIDTRKEISKSEEKLKELQADSKKKVSLQVNVQKEIERIQKLQAGYIYPFETEVLFCLWEKNQETLTTSTENLKASINQMNGAQYFEPLIPSSAKNLFCNMIPGWTYGNYKKHSLYAESNFLPMMLPLSSTYTGLLKENWALFAGDGNSIIGVNPFYGDSPQHAFITGMTGFGKSALMTNLLTQTDPFFDFTCIVEEGKSYGLYTLTHGTQPIIVKPDIDLTINYFDTAGLPLTNEKKTFCTAFINLMCGEGEKAEEKIRTGIITDLVNKTYKLAYQTWEYTVTTERRQKIAKYAMGTEWLRGRMTGSGITLIDRFIEFKELLENNDAETVAFMNSITSEQADIFAKDKSTEELYIAIAYAFMKPENYPTHTDFYAVAFSTKFTTQKESDMARIQIARAVKPWCAGKGNMGKLFDGVTNVNLKHRLVHFELGEISDSAKELKQAIGFLISEYVRNYIMTMPRKYRKRIIFEEVGRFLEIPGGDKIVREFYAQMRKFNCWSVSIVQQYSRFKECNVRDIVVGASKQYFLLGQRDVREIEKFVEDSKNISETSQARVLQYPDPKQTGYSAFLYCVARETGIETGTGLNFCSPEMLYVSRTDNDDYYPKAKKLLSNQGGILAGIKQETAA